MDDKSFIKKRFYNLKNSGKSQEDKNFVKNISRITSAKMKTLDANFRETHVTLVISRIF